MLQILSSYAMLKNEDFIEENSRLQVCVSACI